MSASTVTSPADAAGDELLVIQGLTVTQLRPARTLVRDVSLTLGRGQTLGIVGESGSGKSLTARSIVGLLPAGLRAGGSGRFDGIPLIGSSERVYRTLRGPRISLLLQDPFTMLNPLQTAGTHIAESLPAGTSRGRRVRREEVTRRLAEVGLGPEVADRYPFELSGGMRQRVALAAALAGDPELLIADEPTTALDVTTQSEVLSLLRRIQTARGMALILITHDLRVAFSVCDRIQVMYAGSVVERAPAVHLQSGPLHPYSLGLMLSDPPLDRYVDTLRSIPGSVPTPDAVRTSCAFADRCTWAEPECRTSFPPLATVDPDHQSSCRRIGTIRLDLQEAVTHFEQASALPPRPAVGRQLLTVNEVRKSFRSSGLVGRARTATALNGVSLEVGEAESVGLVGETGSGKSTIARSVLGLSSVDSGRIELGGIDISAGRRRSREDLRRLRQLVQVVFQDPYASLNPALSVGDTLGEALSLRDTASDDPAADDGAGPGGVAELLGLVGLPAGYADRRPAALSGGERQRVAIARAIAVRPKLLICDEPVAALDVSAQAQVLELLRSIRQRYSMAMLFITHDLSVVRQMADRLVVLYRGEVVETGATASVLDNPQHAYTRRLIAAVPGRQQAGAAAEADLDSNADRDSADDRGNTDDEAGTGDGAGAGDADDSLVRDTTRAPIH